MMGNGLSKPLGDLAEVRGGYGFSPSYQGSSSGDFPFFKVSDMNTPGNEVALSKAVNYVSQSVVDEIGARLFPSGAVVFPKVGGAIHTNKKRMLSQPSLIDNNMMGVFPRDREVCRPRYLYYWFQRLNLTTIANPGPLPSINGQAVKRLLIALPEGREQDRIVELLNASSESLGLQRKMVAVVSELRRETLRALIKGGPADSNSSDEAWPLVKLGDACLSHAFGPRFGGDLYHDSGNVAALRTTDIDEFGRINYATMPRARLDLGDFSNHVLQDGDLVVTRSGTCGLAAVFEQQQIPVLPGAFLIRFRLSERANPRFVELYLNSPQGQEAIAPLATGAVQKNLTSGSLLNLEIPLPPRPTQDKFVAVIRAMDMKLGAEETRARLLAETGSRLMGDVMHFDQTPPQESAHA